MPLSAAAQNLLDLYNASLVRPSLCSFTREELLSSDPCGPGCRGSTASTTRDPQEGQTQGMTQWQAIARHWSSKPDIYIPRGSGRKAMDVMKWSDRRPVPDAATKVKKELARLDNRLRRDTASVTEIAHYILFSYALDDFDASKIGAAQETDLHVMNPPSLPALRIFNEMAVIKNEELRRIAKMTFRKMMRSLSPKGESRSIIYAALDNATQLVQPKAATNHHSYYP